MSNKKEDRNHLTIGVGVHIKSTERAEAAGSVWILDKPGQHNEFQAS